MALARRDVHQPSFGDQVGPLASGERVLIDEFPDSPRCLGGFLQIGFRDLIVEVARVREHDAVFHRGEVRGGDDILAAGRGDDEVRLPHRASHREDFESVHGGLDGFHRIDLGDDDPSPHAAGPHRYPAPRPSVSRHHEGLARDQEVRRVHQPIERALARPVPVVEEVLHLGVIHIDDGEPKRSVSFHRSESDDARRRLFVRSPDTVQEFPPVRVQEFDEVRAVVDDEVRLQVEDLVEVRIVLVVRLPLLRVDVETVLLREGRGDTVVG